MENTTEHSCCQEKDHLTQLKNPRFVLAALGIVILGSIAVVSILRERIVNPSQNQVTISGRGKVEYQPDTATVNLGVQVDKAPTAENALSQLNANMNQIISAEKALGVSEDKIKTQNYSLSPQYDYKDGVMSVSGYTANQQLSVKVEGIKENSEALSKVISEASRSGANQVLGVRFETANLDELKQQARILAIQDAKAKSQSIASAAGVKLGKITTWYENILASPDFQDYQGAYGLGAGGDMANAKIAPPQPQIPSGTQEIVIEMSVSYEVE